MFQDNLFKASILRVGGSMAPHMLKPLPRLSSSIPPITDEGLREEWLEMLTHSYRATSREQVERWRGGNSRAEKPNEAGVSEGIKNGTRRTATAVNQQIQMGL